MPSINLLNEVSGRPSFAPAQSSQGDSTDLIFLGLRQNLWVENDGAARLGLDRRGLPPTFTFAPPC